MDQFCSEDFLHPDPNSRDKIRLMTPPGPSPQCMLATITRVTTTSICSNALHIQSFIVYCYDTRVIEPKTILGSHDCLQCFLLGNHIFRCYVRGVYMSVSMVTFKYEITSTRSRGSNFRTSGPKIHKSWWMNRIFFVEKGLQ